MKLDKLRVSQKNFLSVTDAPYEPNSPRIFKQWAAFKMPLTIPLLAIKTYFCRKPYGMPLFFTKKRFLIDSLEGFVDIHNHILPGIDDGAKTVADSMALLKGFAEFGVHRFITTPHIMHNYYPNTPTTITAALNRLKKEMLHHGLKDSNIEAAAEHMIDDNFETLLENDGIMRLKADYLLVEMSFLQPPLHISEAIEKTTGRGLFPILAHPERYLFLHQSLKKYDQFKAQGVLFQMNMLSLSSFYGKEVQKTAFKLLERGQIDFLGSDVHNLSQLHALKEITLSKKNAARLLSVIDQTIGRFY
ncbi:CpsB/CapC family capsule biosynthesis tyrosine phosphatase [Arenibacter sp. GZD96]|uniref:tyrosine-protein phosphatase n=1 Tax=Aurantibrevibacter litoralis TaxID=3106030 RepID=UPI002AFDDD32|nr:CpsB/CapC family capsule biosynthesis tyrosine phosphatase [Arenibacter sp. GZD-96]MEA1785980.1 CpsB/CapC family capsule biosynthesis tyrosine phosphatase [Arenibacter sp. GZD-96]